MKRKLFNLLLLAAMTTGVQAQLNMVKETPNLQAAARSMQKVTIDPSDNQAWWGYVGAEDPLIMLGVQSAETYDCAVFIPGNHPVAAGKTINAIRFALIAPNVKNVKVWVAESIPSNVDKNTIETVNVTSLDETGFNDVALTTPYTIGSNGVYVGYSFTVTKVQYQEDAYPILVTGEPAKNMLWLRTSKSVTQWGDLNSFGRLYLQVLLEGEFDKQNAARPADFGEVVVAAGSTGKTLMNITNEGATAMTSFDYTITSDGVTSEEKHFSMAGSIGFCSTRPVELEIDADEPGTVKTKTLTITKVNGELNEIDNATAQFTVSTVNRLVPRGIAVEELTGTGCPWCPRGLAGMEKLRDKYGDSFIGIGIHQYNNSDAMYISNYTNLNFSGAPSCYLNRKDEIDPFYGSNDDICTDFEEEMNIPAKASIEVTGEWNEDCTQVQATATVESLLEGGDYKIEYVLIADDLSGTGSAWNQSNNYSSYSASGDPYLDQFCRGGKYGKASITGYHFNDVALASSMSKAKALGTLSVGEPVTNTYTLSMPTKATLKNAITNEKVAVVALLIDKSNNRVANAAKTYMTAGPSTAIADIVEGNQGVEARYGVDGRQLTAPQRGLNIIRRADGTTMKVLVR